MSNYKYAAPCLMGVEKLLANELKFMGACDVIAENGRVFFSGGENIAVRANLRSRIAERVLLVCAEFSARSFDELYEGVRAVKWADYLPKNAAFPVTGKCLSSKLMSVSDCQGIIKKACAESLKSSYRVHGMLDESGNTYKIRFLIYKDKVSVMIDTSGEPLHKRGYRAVSNAAPMKETLAAALVEFSGVRKDTFVIDPFCGSGTILIESAQKALGIYPGLQRKFACDKWELISPAVWEDERNLALMQYRSDSDFQAVGYDIDESSLKIARENAKLAGVADRIKFIERDIRDFCEDSSSGIVICNPPYGERLLDIKAAEELYRIMGQNFAKKDNWEYNIICPDDDFEKCFGRRADKRRKLYNGMLCCQLYRYFR
ncbi:MAG: class I SAM-dependent RNA methyltransferase [Clostridia bacterium]|nr:class I SAM-dependent RNA methyltransferase [Clostridia bacterium]